MKRGGEQNRRFLGLKRTKSHPTTTHRAGTLARPDWQIKRRLIVAFAYKMISVAAPSDLQSDKAPLTQDPFENN
jgi:hypothetical protein